MDLASIHRVGALIPCTNAMIEPELNRFLPEHYQLYVSRLRMGPIDERGWRMQDADIDYQARLLGSVNVGYVFLAQTNASFFAPRYDETVTQRILNASGAPAAATCGQLTARAMKALGARRIAFISPYSDALNEMGRRYYQDAHGLEVVVIDNYGQPATSDAVNDILPEAATAALKRANRAEVEGFIVAGGALPTLHLIDSWERSLGKPVVTTNQVAMWAILGAFGRRETLAGLGRLLALESGEHQ